jgi:hypothetical protein
MRIILAVAAALVSAQADAAPAVGLRGDSTLVFFDTAAPSRARTVEVSGFGRLAGLDLRPSNGALMAVAMDGAIIRIDPDTGAATRTGAIIGPMPAGDGPVVVDFNPAADKLRLMRGTTNHRVDVDSGKLTVDGSLAFEENDMHAIEAPNIVAAAYSAGYGRPDKTAMYDVDATIGALIRQTKPNDGTLAAIGKFGIPAAQTYAFDIATNAEGVDTAWLVAGDMLHTVDLETGAATRMARLAGATARLRDIAILMDR